MGDGGYTGDPKLLAPYLTWAADPPLENASKYAALGVKLYRYEDSFKSYKAGNDFTYQDLVHANTAAIAKDCSGNPITFGNGAALATDPRDVAAGRHFSNSVMHDAQRYRDVRFSAWFEDDTDNTQHTDNGNQACNYTIPTWISATRSMWRAADVYGAKPRIIFNGLNLAVYGVDLKPLLNDSQVIGAMWEGCYGGTNGFGLLGDYVNDINKKWILIENDELSVGKLGKAFWCFNENDSASATSQAHRLYTYASYLLTYSPLTSVYQTAYRNHSGAHLEPETGFVPLLPLKSRIDEVSALRQSTGVYSREYADCYYRGSRLGSCAVVVNPDPVVSHAFPYNGKYRHMATLSGAGVLDGGSVSFTVGALPIQLAPTCAVIAIR